MRKTVCSILLVFLCRFASGQIGDTLRSVDSTLYTVNHITTGIYNFTNDNRTYLLSNSLKFMVARKRISLSTVNGWVYGAQQAKLTNNDFSSVVDVTLFKTVQKLYYWALVTYDKSYSLKIDNRVQTGIGLGYNLVALPYFQVILSDGPLYERADLYDTTAYSTVRNSFRLRYRVKIAKMISLEGTNFLQQSFIYEKDYILKFDNTLSFKLQKWLSFTVATSYNKVNIGKKENFLCTVGFTFQKTYASVKKKLER